MSFQHDESAIRTISHHAKIALGTACLARITGVLKGDGKLHQATAGLVDDLWSWQTDGKTTGRDNMTEQEARTLPSYVLYWKYDTAFLALPHIPARKNAVNAAAMLHGFACWLIEGMEGFLNRDKPFVTDSDILEGKHAWLLESMDWSAEASQDGQRETAWQRRAIQKLQQHHSIKNDDYHGAAVPREFFEDIRDPVS